MNSPDSVRLLESGDKDESLDILALLKMIQLFKKYLELLFQIVTIDEFENHYLFEPRFKIVWNIMDLGEGAQNPPETEKVDSHTRNMDE